MSKKRTIYLGYQPHGSMPEILYLSDLVVLPQKDNHISRAQVPGKIFEAMAMAKPIVATAVLDLPEILKDCSVIVKAGDTEDLAKNVQYVLANPNVGRMLGRKARNKCVKLYSFEAMARVLFPVFQQFEKRLKS
jgi:glycosyltransferase involved in cell wall biosynthesis